MKRRSRRNSSEVVEASPSASASVSMPSIAGIAPWAVLGSGAAVLGWVAYRLHETAQLAELLANTVRIQTLRKEYQAAGKAPVEFQWILDGAWESRASAALPVFSMVSVDEAYQAIKATLPKVAPQTALSIDAIRDQLKALGLDLPPSVDEAIDVLDAATKKLSGSGALNQPRP